MSVYELIYTYLCVVDVQDHNRGEDQYRPSLLSYIPFVCINVLMKFLIIKFNSAIRIKLHYLLGIIKSVLWLLLLLAFKECVIFTIIVVRDQ